MDGLQYLRTVVLCLVVTSSLSEAFNLTILHTNDIHARIQEMDKYNGRCSPVKSAEGKCYGGMERLKTKVDEMRAKFPDSLLLDGGDQYQGTLLFYAHGGLIMSHFMNIMGYDAMGLGNHEFDNGPEGLEPFLDNVTFPVLSCNIDGLDKVKKTTVVEVSGRSVGIVGYTTASTPIISRPGHVKFTDEITSIQLAVDALKQKGVDIVIAVGHAGFGKDKEIAQKVNGVDVVVGGHTNTFLYNGKGPAQEIPKGVYPTVVPNDNGQNVLVVQDFAYGKYLGFLQVEFDDQGKPIAYNGNPILLDKTVPKDPEVTKVIKAYLPKVEKMMSERVGISLVQLDGDRSTCRVKECNMGNLVADAMVRQNLRYADSLEWNHVSIALVNSGGVRSSLTKGNITAADVLQVQPFRNTVDIAKLTGSVILQILEHSASGWVNAESDDLFGGFLQVAGLRVVYDMRKKAGKRVVEVLARCADCEIPEYKPLKMTKVYKVLMSSYLTNGGDGYAVIKENVGAAHTIGDVDSELMLAYITENSPITTGIDGRIRFVQDIEASPLCDGLNLDRLSSLSAGHWFNKAPPSVMKSSMFSVVLLPTILSLVNTY